MSYRASDDADAAEVNYRYRAGLDDFLARYDVERIAVNSSRMPIIG